MSVLVLNKNWQPVHVCSANRAISLVFQNAAKVVDRDYQIHSIDSWRELSEMMVEMKDGAEDLDLMRSPTWSLVVPEVILLADYQKVPPFSIRLNRRNLFLRDNNQCQYCGKKPSSKELTIDHVVPRCQGGKTTWDNVAIACVDCNSKKGGKTPQQANMQLRTKPKKPSWASMLRKKRQGDLNDHPLWARFIDQAYWNVTLEK